MTTFPIPQPDFKTAALTSAPNVIFDWTKAQPCSLLLLVAATSLISNLFQLPAAENQAGAIVQSSFNSVSNVCNTNF